MENIIAKMPGSVYWMDREGNYLGCNDNFAKLFNLKSRQDIIGKSYAHLYDEKSAFWYKKADRHVMDTGTSFSAEEPLFLPDGKKQIYLSNKVPLYNLKKEVIGMLGVSINITERKKIEEELIQSKKTAEAASYLMTEFVSNMGHDLATPISDVGGIAQLLLNYADEYPELKEDFELLATRSNDCEKVRQRIINATSIANLEIKVERFSIGLVLLAVEKELRPTIGSKNLKIIIYPIKPKKDDFIVTDFIKFHDILLDILSNAINFTEKGQVTISVIKQDNLFHIKIADTGIGIPSDKFDYIFQQYAKLSRSNRYGSNFRGIGAGLYLARVRANILKATISVESEVGKGSTFTFSIPTLYSEKEI